MFWLEDVADHTAKMIYANQRNVSGEPAHLAKTPSDEETLTRLTLKPDPETIKLVNITGERARPVKEKGTAFPVSALTSQSIAPGATVKGYLYYPAGTYTGARGSLTEKKSQEREGFEAPFH